MRYELAPLALKQLQKLPKSTQKRIINKLDYYSAHEHPLHFADHLIHPSLGSYRHRVGDYRVIFDVEGDILIILAVGHRREIYK